MASRYFSQDFLKAALSFEREASGDMPACCWSWSTASLRASSQEELMPMA